MDRLVGKRFTAEVDAAADVVKTARAAIEDNEPLAQRLRLDGHELWVDGARCSGQRAVRPKRRSRISPQVSHAAHGPARDQKRRDVDGTTGHARRLEAGPRGRIHLLDHDRHLHKHFYHNHAS